MAARWRTADETLTACHMEFSPMDSLDETAVLSAGETLEALQSCLDPSILSLFEDTPTIETKGIDESEATLLTALTEILDNVDDENLSPFDTLPDSELLSGPKGRENSPLRRLFCLSRSPPEKDTPYGARPSSIGKSLPRIQAGSLQRSDGEEEEDRSLTLSPVGLSSSPDNNLLDWGSLTLPLPVSFEKEGEEGVSVSLGDLVRQMHPYCMTICVENEEGEQLLPEGGILLEVVDQGENGEPILAIPDMDLPVNLPHKEQSSDSERKLSNEDDVFSDSSEHIVVDDEDTTAGEAPLRVGAAPHVTPDRRLNMKDEMIVKRQKEAIKEKSPSRRKKKKKCKEPCQPPPVEGRVLRSGRVRNIIQESPRRPNKRSVKAEKKQNLPKGPLVPPPSSVALKPNESNPCQTKAETEISTTLMPETKVQVATSVSLRQEAALLDDSAERSLPSLPTAVQSQKPDEKPNQPAPANEMVEYPSAAPSTVAPPASSESRAAAPSPITPPVSEALPSVVPAVPEPKPKPLSLAEYRRLRQQKKPTPVENQENPNCSKWPSLPELPTELPPIPCLPSPSDPRRHSVHAEKKEVDEVRPAWQPRGPCAPPTPEALLVPPAYMVSSSSKVTAAAPAPKTQQTSEREKPSATQMPSSPAPKSAKNVPPHQHTTAVSSVPPSSGSPASLKPDTPCMSSADGKRSPALSGEKARDDDKPRSQPVSPKSVELTRTSPETTTEPIKPAAAPTSAPTPSQKITVVFQKASEVTAPTSVDNTVTSGSNSTKPTAHGTRIASATRPTDSRSLKAGLVLLQTKRKTTTAVKPLRTKSPTQELVEAFTSEIGIEAADLTSLLEQFEESQAKEEQCMLEVSGRAAAVGNSSVDVFPEKTAVERVRANDLSSTAALTPPGTPPHQMWKPLAPVAPPQKSKASEASKPSPSKVIQIDARPLPAVRSRCRPTSATVTPEVACMDHDYCLPYKGTGEPVKRWNVKQQSFITIKPIKTTATTTQSPPAAPAWSVQSTTNTAVTSKTQEFSLTKPLDHRTDEVQRSSVLETPDASPAWQEADDAVKEGSPKKGPFGRTYRRHAASRTPSPRSVPKERTGGPSRKRSRRSPSPTSSSSESDSHSSRSRSRSRSKKRYSPRHSSSSSSSSRSSSRSSASRSPPRRRRYSYSSSRSGSWSPSRSRSRSPQRQSRWSSRRLYRPSHRPSYGHSTKTNTEKMKLVKEKAIEERRVVYVGRIRGTMTQKELRERFSSFGDIEDCTLHFRDQGDNYGFVTYFDTKDAFTAIENGSKLRKPDELPFDLCFGGRRQFCRTSYADLDSGREYDPLSAKGKLHALDFDTLLKQAQQNQKR